MAHFAERVLGPVPARATTAAEQRWMRSTGLLVAAATPVIIVLGWLAYSEAAAIELSACWLAFAAVLLRTALLRPAPVRRPPRG